MKNRFDLEQEIMQCWSVVEDIELLREKVLDGETELTDDELDNFLLGLKTIYSAKFERLFKTF
jgi:hypothetical protein